MPIVYFYICFDEWEEAFHQQLMFANWFNLPQILGFRNWCNIIKLWDNSNIIEQISVNISIHEEFREDYLRIKDKRKCVKEIKEWFHSDRYSKFFSISLENFGDLKKIQLLHMINCLIKWINYELSCISLKTCFKTVLIMLLKN